MAQAGINLRIGSGASVRGGDRRPLSGPLSAATGYAALVEVLSPRRLASACPERVGAADIRRVGVVTRGLGEAGVFEG